MEPHVPAYFDHLLAAYQRGLVGRCVHLGHWDRPPEIPPRPGEFAQAQARLDTVLLDLAGVRDGQTVLDVGCGFGSTLERVNGAHTEMQLVGVNIDLRQLAVCRTLIPRLGNTLEWLAADACALPFAAEVFDRVLCVEALFHFASRRVFFREAARVLRAGGRLVLSDLLVVPSAARLPGVPAFCVEAVLRDGYGPWPDFWSDDADHLELAAAAGLQCLQRLDATAVTRPSHRFTVPPHLDDRRDPGDPTLRAALLLRWLHEQGYLRCVYAVFAKLGPHR